MRYILGAADPRRSALGAAPPHAPGNGTEESACATAFQGHDMALRKDARHHSRAWRELRLHILARDLYACRMCGTLLRGKGKQAPEVDHIRPAELRPDLFFDPDNLWALCKQCHGTTAQAIEKRHGSDDEAIAKAKAAHRPVGLDGYRFVSKSE